MPTTPLALAVQSSEEDAIHEALTDAFELELELRDERAARAYVEAQLSATSTPVASTPVANTPVAAVPFAVTPAFASPCASTPTITKSDASAQTLSEDVALFLAHAVAPADALAHAVVSMGEVAARTEQAARSIESVSPFGTTADEPPSCSPAPAPALPAATSPAAAATPPIDDEAVALAPDSAHERRLRIAAAFFTSGEPATLSPPLKPQTLLSPAKAVEAQEEEAAAAAEHAREMTDASPASPVATAPIATLPQRAPSKIPVVRVLGACNRAGRAGARAVVVRAVAKTSEIPTPRCHRGGCHGVASSPEVRTASALAALGCHSCQSPAHSTARSAANDSPARSSAAATAMAPVAAAAPSTIERGFAALRREIAETITEFRSVEQDAAAAPATLAPYTATASATSAATATEAAQRAPLGHPQRLRVCNQSTDEALEVSPTRLSRALAELHADKCAVEQALRARVASLETELSGRKEVQQRLLALEAGTRAEYERRIEQLEAMVSRLLANRTPASPEMTAAPQAAAPPSPPPSPLPSPPPSLY